MTMEESLERDVCEAFKKGVAPLCAKHVWHQVGGFSRRQQTAEVLQGEEYVVTNLKDSSLATEDQFRNGLVSYAYIHPSGLISRFGEEIGRAEDIELTGETVEIIPTDRAMQAVAEGFRFNEGP